MAKQDLETKCKKAILEIADKVDSIYNTLRDVSMKLCHIIKQNKKFYTSTGYSGTDHNGYENDMI